MFYLLLFCLLNITLTLNSAEHESKKQIEKLDQSNQTDPIIINSCSLNICVGSHSALEMVKKCLKDSLDINPFMTRIVDNPRMDFKFYSITYRLTTEAYEQEEKLITDLLNELKIPCELFWERREEIIELLEIKHPKPSCIIL